MSPTKPAKSAKHELIVEKLLEVTGRLAEEPDPARLMARILDEAIAIVGAERGFVIATQEGGERTHFRVAAARKLDQAEVEKPDFEFSRSVVRSVTKTGKACLVTDAPADPATKDITSVNVLKVRSILCVPLRAEGHLLGAVYLDHRLMKREFSDADLAALEAFAVPAGVVLAAAQRTQMIVRQRDELAERVATIERLRAELAERYLEQSREVNTLRDEQRRPADGELPGFVARSASMKRVIAIVRKAAPSDAPVLITGESGTGKEGLARAIHALSKRAGGPFLAENCAALADPLLESELFGHEKGAFTGAVKERRGLFEMAQGGTLFLDEVGDMSPSLQVKLLRVLQERVIRRVGGTAAIPVDVRIVCATHCDLEAMVAESAFRADLYYRLNVVRIDVPPLRERLACLPALIDSFFEPFHGEDLTVDPQVRELLLVYAWPGNVRELQNEVRRLAVLAGPGGVVRPGLLSPEILAHAGQGPESDRRKAAPKGPLLPGVWRLEAVEREAIERALQHSGGNKTNAARLLGLPKTTLYHRISKLKLDSRDDLPGT
jgi:transcriptional regulator with GAF, ATPase, and Fis domain